MPSEQRGFALIEALIAAVILGVGLIGATKLQLHMMSATQLARQRVEATNWATNQLESLRATDFSALASCPTTKISEPSTLQMTTTYSMSMEWIVCDIPNKILAPLITVTWTDAAGVSNQVKLTTYL